MSRPVLKKWFYAIPLLLALAPLAIAGHASAQQSNSGGYSIDEVQFGTGSAQEMCGDEYCGDAATGSLVVGEGKSNGFSAQFGSLTTSDPMLELIVTNNDLDMGLLDTSTTATGTDTIQVRNYMSSGYIMQMTGPPPKMGSHTFEGMAIAAESEPGIEQFGVNLVNNSSPNIGTDPVQVPSGDFSFGVASIDYNVGDYFKFIDGDVIAESLTSSGRTDYTLSMIMNISELTPGGKYTGKFSIIVTPTF